MDVPGRILVTFIDIDQPPASPHRQWTAWRDARPCVGELLLRPELDDKRRFVRTVFAADAPDRVTAAVSREYDSLFTFKKLEAAS